MKLDVNALRYLSKEDFRVLTAVEMGQKNHEIVPLQLIDSISGLKHGGAFRCLKTLLQHKLVHHDGQKYDGYRLTYMGYDFLALRTLLSRGHISGVGRQIGVGKESDIYEVSNDEGEVFALKLHRLGRTSFRDVASKRDYLGGRRSYSWLYLSRLAALKEFAFMKALGDHGFPVPTAIDHNRHAVLMSLLDAQPLVQVRRLGDPAAVYAQAMGLLHRLAATGLVHCDFNEFNLLIDETQTLSLIDFPQMVSTGHANARELFERDVECVARFFAKKIGFIPGRDTDADGGGAEAACGRPDFDAALAEAAAAGAPGLDVELAASGFKRQHQEALERYAAGAAGDGSGDDDDDDAGGASSDSNGSSSSGASSRDGEAGDAARSSPAAPAEASGAAQAGPEAGPPAASKAGLDDSAADSAAGAHQAPAERMVQRAAAACSASADRRPQPSQRVSAHTQRWLEQHDGQHDAAAAAAEAAAAEAAAAAADAAEAGAAASGPGGDGVGSDAGSGSSDAGSGSGSDGGGAEHASPRAPAAAGQHGTAASVAPSRAATDVSFMGREVQARLVAQRARASARASAAKASRNVSKARGKKAKATAAALAEW